jgi:hypothetical protein
MRRAVDKTCVEYHHEARLAVVFGCFLFPAGYLLAFLVTSGSGWTAGLAEIFAASLFGLAGVVFGSYVGGKMGRASEKRASPRR